MFVILRCFVIMLSNIILSINFFAAMEYKLAYAVIVCCLLVRISLIGMDMVFFHIASIDGTLTYFLSQGVAYLLYPLLGWLADVCITRYKFVLFSFITVIVATLSWLLELLCF